MLRKTMFGALAAFALMLGLISAPASASNLSAQPTAAAQGDRVVVTIKGKKPTKATLIVGGTRYPLKRKGRVWRTKPLSAEALAGLSGAKAKVKVKVKGKNKTLKTSIQGTGTNPTPGTPGTPGPQQLFVAPGVDREGGEAWDAIKGYFADSTLSNCADPRGWPYCQVEERYGFFDSGTQWYCYLTPDSRSDVKSVSNIQRLLFVQQKADGAWRVDYESIEYDKIVYYSVNVAASGAAVVNYWGSGADTSGPPTNQYAGLQWMRGAKDCRY